MVYRKLYHNADVSNQYNAYRALDYKTRRKQNRMMWSCVMDYGFGNAIHQIVSVSGTNSMYTIILLRNINLSSTRTAEVKTMDSISYSASLACAMLSTICDDRLQSMVNRLMCEIVEKWGSECRLLCPVSPKNRQRNLAACIISPQKPGLHMPVKIRPVGPRYRLNCKVCGDKSPWINDSEMELVDVSHVHLRWRTRHFMQERRVFQMVSQRETQ